jgi:hypothetical protein
MHVGRSIYEEFLNNFCLFVKKDSKNKWMNHKPEFKKISRLKRNFLGDEKSKIVSFVF